MVSFGVGDSDDLMYLRYSCSDPTCDWCVIEFGPDECKELERITDGLLTHPIYNDKSQEGGTRVRATSSPKAKHSQLELEEL